MATRRLNALKQSAKRKKTTIGKIENLVLGMFAFAYKKADGTWNIMKIAKDSGVCRNSVYAYLSKK